MGTHGNTWEQPPPGRPDELAGGTRYRQGNISQEEDQAQAHDHRFTEGGRVEGKTVSRDWVEGHVSQAITDHYVPIKGSSGFRSCNPSCSRRLWPLVMPYKHPI